MFDYEDYKGKFNILVDSDSGFMNEDQAFEYVMGQYLLSRYYGVPIYYGTNKRINKVADKLDEIYDEFYNINND